MSSNKVAKNAAWIIGTHIVQSLLSLVIGALVARYLGSDKFGVITYATSLVTFAGDPNTQLTTRIVDRMDALLIVVGRVVSVEVM